MEQNIKKKKIKYLLYFNFKRSNYSVHRYFNKQFIFNALLFI